MTTTEPVIHSRGLTTPLHPRGLTTVDAPQAADPERRPHTFMATFAPNLHSIIIGKAATELLNTTPTTGAAVVTLPTWAWVAATTNVGAKKARTLLPARIQWDTPQVVVTATPLTARWSINTLGHTIAGELRIRPLHHGDRPITRGDGTTVPAAVGAPVVSCRRGASVLTELADDAKAARWDAVAQLEGHVVKQIDNARHHLPYDLNPNVTHPAPLFDDIEADALVSYLMFGSEDTDGSSHMLRLIDRACNPDAYKNVDPMRYITTAIHRDAYGVARQHVGDPKIGGRLRRLATEQGLNTVEEVVTAYRAVHPHDSLSYTRAAKALSAGSHISAVTIAVAPEDISAFARNTEPPA